MKSSTLYRTSFSGAKLAKLAGISVTQFESFRKSGLIKTQPRYSLQDVIFVALTNFLKAKENKSWVSIYKFYCKVFGSPETFAAIPFLELDGIVIDTEENTYKLLFKNDELEELKSKKILSTAHNNELEFLSGMRDNYGLTLKDCFKNPLRKIYIIQIDLVIKEIIENSKDVDLKVDVEQLLSA